jgi:pimeloyl-ACP methyl ester carboxylesterase
MTDSNTPDETPTTAAPRSASEPEIAPPSRRRLPLGALVGGVTLLGAAAAWLSASRRSSFDRRWETLGEPEPFEPPHRAEPDYPVYQRELHGAAGRLHVEDGGVPNVANPPVVFVHGLGGSSAQWAAQLDGLRTQGRAVAFDLRGHGRSERSQGGGYGISDYSADLAAVVGELELDDFVLVGHSLGATVAIDYAGRRPERVAGLLLVDPNGDQTRIPKEELEPFLASLREDPVSEMSWNYRQILVNAEPSVADRVLDDLRQADPEVFLASLRSSFGYSPLKALERYEGPLLSVVSDLNDLPYSLHHLIGDLDHRVLVGTSHWLMMDRPDAFGRLLLEMRDRARSAS